MIITKEFINNNRTLNGAFTNAQFEVIAKYINLKKGWIYRIDGMDMKKEDVDRFIEGKNIFSKKTKNKKDVILNKIKIMELELIKLKQSINY